MNEQTTNKSWEYKGVLITTADRNAYGLRWDALMDTGEHLRSDTKQEMKHLIN